MQIATPLRPFGLRISGWGQACLSLAGIGAIALATPAQAQSVGIGTTKGGATAQVTAAIAKVVSAHAGLQMRPQPYANTSQYIPVVNSGKLEFAASNIFQLTFALNGTGMSEGRPNPNLRMVATLMPFRVAYFVSEKSGIGSFGGLKGKRLPGFKQRALGTYLLLGTAANLNVSTVGWNFVQVPNFPRMWDGFKRGTLDAAIAAVGSKPTRDMKAARGALRILPINDDRDSVARMRRHLPQSYVIAMKANPKLPGLSYDVENHGLRLHAMGAQGCEGRYRLPGGADNARAGRRPARCGAAVAQLQGGRHGEKGRHRLSPRRHPLLSRKGDLAAVGA